MSEQEQARKEFQKSWSNAYGNRPEKVEVKTELAKSNEEKKKFIAKKVKLTSEQQALQKKYGKLFK